MRTLIAALTAMLFPAVAYAQATTPVQLADYASLCLATWAGSPDVPSKASALGLQNVSGIAGARITIGKSTLEVYKPAPGSQAVGNQTVIAVTTVFADGKDSSCDVNIPVPMERADLETMAQALHLDGQILSLGAAILGRWKMPDRQPPVFIRALLPKAGLTMNVQQFEATSKDTAARH